MKKYCKNIDITDRNLISEATYVCLDRKYKRSDVLTMLSQYSNLTPNQVFYIIHRLGSAYVSWIVEAVIDSIREEILTWNIHFIPINYVKKIDPSSRKEREIGIQNIKQQIYDYIAVYALRPIFCRIGEFQVAAIKGRGQEYGIRYIRRWMRNKKIKYLGQADIRKCYSSISREKLMDFLRKHIGNEPLLNLVQLLIYTFKQGLSIGSYLSQFLCNLYLSELYHEIAEHMYRVRKHRDGTTERINLVKHVLFFMDDIFICGTNSKDLHKAIKLIKDKCEAMGLKIKHGWKVFKARMDDETGQFIDIMGVRIYRYHVTIRQRVFLRIRRNLKKIKILYQTHKHIPSDLARKCLSYWGILKNTDSYKLRKRYKTRILLTLSKKVVSINDKDTIRCQARACVA